MTDIEGLVRLTLNTAVQLQERCVGCNTCMHRCDLLEDRQWNMDGVCTVTHSALEGVSDLDGLQRAIGEHSQMYSFIRSCEACDRCTARCPQNLSMGELWRPWRALVRAGGYISDYDVNLVNVDRTWHTFSVFRTLNGVDYSDLPQLQIQAEAGNTESDSAAPACPTPLGATPACPAPLGATLACPTPLGATPACPAPQRSTSDGSLQSHPSQPSQPSQPSGPSQPSQPSQAWTLFFPGCTLASYASELCRTAFSWLEDNVGPCLITEHCCAWPLECAGEIERTVAWREKIVGAARAQGVERIVTVCPGCEKQLAAAAKTVAPDMKFVSFAQLLVEAGVRIDASMLDGIALPVSVVDSCNDRAGAHGPFVRQLFENVDTRPFPCTGQDAWCCGAGGNVAAYDMQLSRDRTRRSFRLCEQVGANTLVAACPTCAYTYAFECWLAAREGYGDAGTPEGNPGGSPEGGLATMPSINYLEIVFGTRINWPAVFDALVDMWQGEHAAWVAEKIG